MTTPAVSLRPASDADLELLYTVFRSTREEEFARAPWNDAERDAFFRMQFIAQHTHYHTYYAEASFDVLLVGDAPAGRLYVLRGEREIRVVDIALLPMYRGAGIGSQLLTDLFAEADREGKTVTIHVEVENPARRLYDRLGFVLIEDKGVYLLMERRPGLR
jgi:ribosomal protein S18 acetylase RimI-like enzyme